MKKEYIKNPEFEAKKNALIQLSIIARNYNNVTDLYKTVNQCIINEFFKKQNPEITDFNTFYGWLEMGYKVNKGEHGYMVWGRPKKISKEKKDSNKPLTDSELEKKYKYYPVAYIFSNLQVTKIQ